MRVPTPEHRSPGYLAKLLRSDIESWADRIKSAGIAGTVVRDATEAEDGDPVQQCLGQS